MQQTIPVNDRIIATAVGTTPSTGPFAVDFPFFSLADVVVTREAAGSDMVQVLVRGADYSLVGVATDDGSFSSGTVTLVLPVANTVITRYGRTVIERLSNFPLQGFFSRLALNAELNRITVVLQEQDSQLGAVDERALHIPLAEANDGLNVTAAPVLTRSNRLLAWDTAGNLSQSTLTLAEIEAGASTGTPAAGFANVQAWGAIGNGLTDDTAAIQAALNSGHAIFLPKGRYLITDMLTVPYGSGIFGETKNFSKLIVPASFNLAALGVIHLATGESTNPSPDVGGNENAGTLKDFSIEFAQPDTAVRANIIHYPPAVYATSSGRFIMQNIRIVRAWIGVWMPGNAGGSFIDHLEASCFNQAIWIDNNLDCTHLSRIHLWPFNCSPNQLTVFQDGNTIGLECGRVDGLFIEDFFAINIPKAIWSHSSSFTLPFGPNFGSMTNIMLDDAGMVIENGTWNISNLYLTAGLTTARPLIVSGSADQFSYVNVSSLFLRCLSLHSSGTVEMIYVGSTGGHSYLNIVGMTGESFSYDRTQIVCEKPGGPISSLAITGGYFIRDGNSTYVNPTINVKSGRSMLSNLSASDKGTGSATFINVGSDDLHRLSGISAIGYGITVPAGAVAIENDTYQIIQTYTPAVFPLTGTITAYTATGRYRRSGRYLKLEVSVTITNNGTGAGTLVVGLPTGFTSACQQILVGHENTTGTSVLGIFDVSQNAMQITTYNNLYPVGTGKIVVLSGEIEIQ